MSEPTETTNVLKPNILEIRALLGDNIAPALNQLDTLLREFWVADDYLSEKTELAVVKAINSMVNKLDNIKRKVQGIE